MVSFIGNNIRPNGVGLIPPKKVISGGYRSVIGNGSGLFSAPFTTEWTVAGDAAARTITLPLVDTRAEGSLSYDCVVDWGDGTTPSLVTAYNDANRIHTYASDGTYRVKIYGVMEGWSFNNGGDKTKIVAVLNWGSSPTFEGFKYLIGGFYGCINLKSIGNQPIPASGTGILSEGFASVFRNCTTLISISSTLFSEHTLAETFYASFLASGLTSIPSGLFDNNTAATNFNSVFYSTAITSIPSGLFDNNTAVTNGFSSAFRDTAITSIPSGLFDNNTAVTNMLYCFYGCSSLMAIPSGLFDNNTLITNFGYCFYGCSSLTAIPSGLFDNNTLITNFGYCFYGCSSLTAIPSGLFDYNTAVTSVQNVFYGTSITSIPSGLFDSSILITNFIGCFRETPITVIPSGLFDNNTVAQYFSNCFRDTDIASIPANLFDNNTSVLDFIGVFRDCALLATTPSELFRFNTACLNFSYAFFGCVKHQENIDLFYQAGEEGTRFLNQSVDFTSCFDRPSFTGTQGTAPDLWNCSFGTGTPTTTDCWNGAGNSAASLTNYASIPVGWL